MTDPLDYFKTRVGYHLGFIGLNFACEDKNLRAFATRDTFRDWYGQPPGLPGESYRDEGFYTRELARLSQLKPKKIVEIGTSLGIGTLLLSILNPGAQLVTIDHRTRIPAGDGKEYVVGSLASWNGADFIQIVADSKDQIQSGVELCFIDGGHDYDTVLSDSHNAWVWRADKWAIAWHDYNDRHPGVMRAVGEFCSKHNLWLQQLPDSSTVWAQSEDAS